MDSTHKEARRLIQFDADQALNVGSLAVLSAHLANCSACRLYAREIRGRKPAAVCHEKTLGYRPSPHSRGHSKQPGFSSAGVSTTDYAHIHRQYCVCGLGVRTARPATAGTGRQSIHGCRSRTHSSVLSTATSDIPADCEVIIYIVQTGDTLERLVVEFAVAKEDLVAHNGLLTEGLTAGMELRIPLYHSAPTGTVIATIFTETKIPVTSGIPSRSGPGQ